MTNLKWIGVLIIDFAVGQIINGLLQGIIEINQTFGLCFFLLLSLTDFIIYIKKGYNLITKIIPQLESN